MVDNNKDEYRRSEIGAHWGVPSKRIAWYDSWDFEKDKSFLLEERGEAYQIVLECLVTNYLQEEIDRCNLYYLKNFRLRLIMVESNK